ncbi:MAG: hypothetical protein FJ118_00085 [Deltaproteobacteria bacterium]|nr:hypothetical protein [Deltaproteobacteria bacterium]
MGLFKDRVDPEELVERVKAGALKGELAKDYKISDEELAMILLPLYRKGELTKDEFNDFFQGRRVKRTQEPVSQTQEMAVAAALEIGPEIVPEEHVAAAVPERDPLPSSPPELEEEAPHEGPFGPSSRIDFSSLENILKRIWKKLDLIDRRLSEIEKRFPEH